METGVIFSPSPFPFTFSSKLQLTPPNPKNLRKFSALCSTISPNNNSQESNSSNNNGGSKETNSPTALNIRYRARSRRRQAKQEKRKQEEEEAKPSKKKWEEMRVSEKALELYLGEKGLLFWLNKLAYASIFLVIGGWILFRFVGPSLGLYQLDSLPLSPTSIFKNG